MDVLHIIGFVIAAFGYRSAQKIITTEKQDFGVVYREAIFKQPHHVFRQGKDAVTVGKIAKATSVMLGIVTLVDFVFDIDLILPAIVILILLHNIVLNFVYPPRTEHYPPKHVADEN